MKLSDYAFIDQHSEKISSKLKLSNELFVFFYVNRFFRLYDFKNTLTLFNFLLLIPNLFIIFLLSFFVPIYILLFFKNYKINDSFTKVYISRSFTSHKKVMSLLDDDTIVLFDSLHRDSRNKAYNIYRQCFFTRLKCVFFAPFIIFKEVFAILVFVFKYLKFIDVFEIINFYKVRLVTFCVFEFYFDNFIRNNSFVSLITTNKECRYSGLDIYLCRKYNLTSICYPHGIEYSFKLPLGLPGDKFYCLSSNSKDFLENLYDNKNKFIFDKYIAESLLAKRTGTTNTSKRIVFFTESRNIDANKNIIVLLLNSGVEFNIQLHPSDSIKNYPEFPKILFEKVNNSIVSNYIIARKSTVLLEGIYNDSICIAVLLDENDRMSFQLFPSLYSPKIQRIYDSEKFISYLRKINV